MLPEPKFKGCADFLTVNSYLINSIKANYDPFYLYKLA